MASNVSRELYEVREERQLRQRREHEIFRREKQVIDRRAEQREEPREGHLTANQSEGREAQ